MKKFKLKIKIPPLAAALVTVALILAVSVGAVYAYLKMTANEASDSFSADTAYQPAAANVLDDWTVRVGNDHTEYAMYVRAAVVPMWKDSEGNVLSVVPEACTYTIGYNTSDWFSGSDGYYYFKYPVYPQLSEAQGVHIGTTTKLINSVTTGDNVPQGYTLSVDVFAQTIQAVGTTDAGSVPAVNDAWGNAVQVNADGTLSAKN